MEQDLGCIKLWIRDLILSRLLADHRPVLQTADETPKTATAVAVETLLSLFRDIEDAQRLIRQNANKQLTLERCLSGDKGKALWRR